MICSGVFPRSLAISPKLLICANAFNVAFTTFKRLADPRDLARTSFTPTASIIDLTAPPAITPVPLEAERIKTVLEPCLPIVG